MVSQPSRSPSGSKHSANLAPCGTTSCKRCARCACLSEQAELVTTVGMVWLRNLCQTELVQALRLSPVPLGEIERVQALVHLYCGSIVCQVLIGKDHPLKNLAILRHGLQLALA